MVIRTGASIIGIVVLVGITLRANRRLHNARLANARLRAENLTLMDEQTIRQTLYGIDETENPIGEILVTPSASGDKIITIYWQDWNTPIWESTLEQLAWHLMLGGMGHPPPSSLGR